MKKLCGQCGDSLHWRLDLEISHLIIEGSGPMWDYTMESSISTHPWDNSIVSVSLPEGITHIGDYAFDHTQLSGSVKVPRTVTSIGIGAFMHTDIRVIQLNEGLRNIAPYAFYGTSMNTLSIPNTVVHLSGWSIGEVGVLHIPSGLESLGISHIHLSDTPTHLCEKKPAIIVLHGEYPIIPWSRWWPIFRDFCGDVFYPENWKDLPELWQYHPEDEVVQTWRPYKIGATPWIEARIIRGVCGDKLHWELDCNSHLKISGMGAMFDFDDYCPCPWPKEISSVTFEEGISHIGAYAFEQCTLCGEVGFPSTLKSIGDNAFASTQLCGTLRLPAGLEIIGSHAFADTHISKLVLGDNLKKIGNSAFAQTYLKEVFLPPSVETIENFAFWGYPSYVERIVMPSELVGIGIDTEYDEYNWYLFGRGYQGPAEVYLYGNQPTDWEKWHPVFAYMEGSVFYPDNWNNIPNPGMYFNVAELIDTYRAAADISLESNDYEDAFGIAEADWFMNHPATECGDTSPDASEEEKRRTEWAARQKWIPYPSELMSFSSEELPQLLKIADYLKKGNT